MTERSDIMRVALIWGNYLSLREMVSYVPLKQHYDIIAFSTLLPEHDLDLIDLPIKKLFSVDYIVRKVPGLNWLLNSVTGKDVENLFYMFGLDGYLKSMDIVQIHEPYHPYSYQAIRAKRKYGCKLIVDVEENIPFAHENMGLRRRVKRTVLENADLIFTPTRLHVETLVLEGVPREKICLIPRNKDLFVFRPQSKDAGLLTRLGLKSHDFVVLFVGRLVWQKGIYDLIRAAKRLSVDSEINSAPIKYIIVGDGPERRDVQRLLDRLELSDRVRLVGKFPYAEMPKVHNLADIFVLPSIPIRKWQEQFGHALIESMASGKAVIGALSGGIPEVIGEAGVLVPPHDYVSLSEQIKRLILEDELREGLGKKARERALQEFDCQKVAEQIREAYQSLFVDSKAHGAGSQRSRE